MPSVNIAKLSATQLRKIRQGKPFYITASSATYNYSNGLQHKGFNRNTKKGKSYTIVYEGVKVGSGIIGDLAGIVHPMAGVSCKA
jgi:hypothetical protein